jgi:hypothetical protein
VTPVDNASTNELGAAPLSRAGWGAVVMATTLVAAAVFGWRGVLSLPEAWQQEEYSHGWLIPPIALYLFSRRYQLHEFSGSRGAAWPGVALGLLSLVLVAIGNLAQVPDIVA